MPHLFATAAKGTEGAVRDELRALGLRRVRARRGGVGFEGDLVDGMRAALWCRLPQRLLLEVGRGPAPDADALYAAAAEVPWEDWMDRRRRFAVQATGRSEALRHTRFTALKVKDALVDRLRERLGGRPDVSTRDPDVGVVVHLDRDEAVFYLDLSGQPLHRRGWRTEAGEAPLRETLAAAVLALGEVPVDRPLLDPMCGSGTLVIEAAQRARRMAPGLGRRFGFERWPAFDGEARRAWQALQEEARDTALPRAPAPILGRDFNEEVLETAVRNARRAGVSEDVAFERRDARDLAPLPEDCVLVTNPPYGERLGRRRLQLEGLFRQLGEAWRALPGDHPLVVLAGYPGFERAFGAKAARRHTLFNGPLETRLLSFPGRKG